MRPAAARGTLRRRRQGAPTYRGPVPASTTTTSPAPADRAGVVGVTFAATLAIGRALRLPWDLTTLVASGFSICGAAAVAAADSVVRARREMAATAIGLVGGAALSVAVTVKLARGVMLAPVMTALAWRQRRRDAAQAALGPGSGDGDDGAPAARPPLVAWFVVGFLAAVLLRTWVPLPEELLAGADTAQTWLLAAALFALGTGVRLRALVTTGWRALVVALGSWFAIAAMALAAVHATV